MYTPVETDHRSSSGHEERVILSAAVISSGDACESTLTQARWRHGCCEGSREGLTGLDRVCDYLAGDRDDDLERSDEGDLESSRDRLRDLRSLSLSQTQVRSGQRPRFTAA